MKTVLLTGASSGLGTHLALTLLQEGYFVILHYYKSYELVKKIYDQYPNQSIIIEADLKNETDIAKIAETLKTKKISLDILINNAAIDHLSDLKEKNSQTFLEVWKLNTLGPFLLMKTFCEEIEKNQGWILNISSDNTIDQYDIVSLEYDTSKAGLNQLTKTFAKFFPKSKINAICFGWLDTKMNQIPPEVKQEIPFVPFELATQKVLEWIQTDQTGKIEVVR